MSSQQLQFLPMTDRVPLRYGGQDIGFDADKRFVSLTDLWRAAGSPSGKEPAIWRRRDDAASFIKDLACSLNVRQSHVLTSMRGKGGATWAHWQIGLAYAKHLSNEFHRFVNEAFREWAEERADPTLKVERAIDAYRRRGKDLGWIEERVEGIAQRKSLVVVMADHNCKVKGKHDNPFSEGTRAISLAALGKTPKEIKSSKGLAKSARTRDYLAKHELSRLRFAECEAERLITETEADGNEACVEACRRAGRAVRAAIESLSAA